MSNRNSLYSIEDGKLVRKNRICRFCGPGVFMAVHGNRTSCGRCGYTLFGDDESEAEPEITEVATSAPEIPAASEEE